MLKKKPAPKTTKKKIPKAKTTKKVAKKPKEDLLGKPIGEVTHYFTHLKVAVVKLKNTLSASDKIHVKGHTSDWSQKVSSMQIDGKAVEKAPKGKSIGLKVTKHAREGDSVYKED